MRTFNILTVSVAASLMLSAVAYADEPSSQAVGPQSQIVNSTALPWNLNSRQVASPSGQRYPAAHWTAAVGTGGAAAVGAGSHKADAVSAARAPRAANPDWTAAIGTGNAAALRQQGS
jgi:hypothetical protein